MVILSHLYHFSLFFIRSAGPPGALRGPFGDPTGGFYTIYMVQVRSVSQHIFTRARSRWVTAVTTTLRTSLELKYVSLLPVNGHVCFDYFCGFKKKHPSPPNVHEGTSHG